MKPDLLITWIKHTDYPLFRKFLRDYESYFNKIIIYFSEHNRFPYYDHFIQDSIYGAATSLEKYIFLDPVETNWGKEDWRNKSTNEMLKYSDSEWVCSIEQDWFAKDMKKLLDDVYKSMGEADLIGWWQENNKYIHPSFWFIKREMLEKTNKDFAAHDGHDHFGWITKDVERLGGKIVTTQQLGYADFIDCFHLGGVNQNHLEGLKPEFVFHRPDIFSVYTKYSIVADVSQHPLFVERSKQILERLQVNPSDEEKWKEFFI